MKIECSVCGTSGRVDLASRPAGVDHVRCPRCDNRIHLPAQEAETPVLEMAAGTPSPAPAMAAAPAGPGIATIPLEPAAPPVPKAACALCHQSLPRPEMVRFGQDWVCATCKPDYVEMMQQGVSPTADLSYAGFWTRFAAKFLDGLIFMLLYYPFTMAIGVTGSEQGAGLLFLLQVVIPITYTVFFLGKFGATPGKMVCKLKVVTADGEAIGYGRALGRYFAEILSAMILYIGFIMAAFDEEKRALHDRICSTRVVFR